MSMNFIEFLGGRSLCTNFESTKDKFFYFFFNQYEDLQLFKPVVFLFSFDTISYLILIVILSNSCKIALFVITRTLNVKNKRTVCYLSDVRVMVDIFIYHFNKLHD